MSFADVLRSLGNHAERLFPRGQIDIGADESVGLLAGAGGDRSIENTPDFTGSVIFLKLLMFETES